MKKNSRMRRGVCFIVLFVLAEINCGRGVSPKGVSKGQPELLQPLDNHPLQVEEDASTPTAPPVSYRRILTRKIDKLLIEAVAMLGHVEDATSRQWLEVFIYKMGAMALDLQGTKHQEYQVEFPSLLPTSSPLSAAKNSKVMNKYQVTSAQINDVIPANEGVMNHQVVTKPGFTVNSSEEEEDELVRQLHDEDRRMRAELKAKQAKAKSLEEIASKAPKEIASKAPKELASKAPKEIASKVFRSVGSEHGGTKPNEGERQLLHEIIQELSALQDYDDVEELTSTTGKADGTKKADFPEFKPRPNQKQNGKDKEEDFEVVEDVPNEDNIDHSLYTDTDMADFNFYFPSTVPPLLKHISVNPHFRNHKGQPGKMLYQHENGKDSTQKFMLHKQNPQSFAYPYWIVSYPVTKQPQPNGEQPSKYSNTDNKPENDAIFPHFDGSTPPNESDFQKLQSQRSIANEGTVLKTNAYPDDYLQPLQQVPAKPQHALLQHMMLSERQNYIRNHQLKTNRPDFRYEKGIAYNGNHNNTGMQMIPKIYPSHIRPLAGSFKKQAHGYLNPGYNAQQRAYAEGPFQQKPNIDFPQYIDTKSLAYRDKNRVPKEPPTKTAGNMRNEQIFLPKQPDANPQMHDMERQLRAGKVVILSDSVVKTNFNKNPPKMGMKTPDQENAPLEMNGTAYGDVEKHA